MGTVPPGHPGGATQLDGQLEVRAFRFYRAEGGETLVTGLIEIPYPLLTRSGDGTRLSGEVAVTVRDSAGLELHHSTWNVAAAATSRSPAATVLETVEFKLAGGRYDLEVSIRDSSGRVTSRRVPISAYRGSPSASDVVLSPSMRLADAKDTTLGPGERRWSNLILTPATHLQLTPVRSRLYYLVEAYPERDTALTMVGQVINDSGRVVVATAARRVSVAQGGAVLHGQIDLTGLPAGHYKMSVRLSEGARTEERSDDFTMADFAVTMEAEKSRLASMRETDAGYFGLMNEDQLNQAEAPLTYITSSDSLSVWKSGLSLSAKREFLTRFWRGRDPSPETVRNEAREQFYARIDEANRRFTEGGRTKTLGWRTDRGRISIVNGDPTEQLDRRVSSGTAPPYLVWRNERGKARYYIFADRTGIGNYKLIASNDLKETGVPGFRDILGAEALQDISRWLGLDLFAGDRSGGSTSN
jgi:GWxTD domain-containing protein